jgi:hypothetical protein
MPEGSEPRLVELLPLLPEEKAVALALAVETQRAIGRGDLPAEFILARLRPTLAAARPRRIPTLCRAVCNGFEEFLVNHRDQAEPGRVARASIAPWWAAIKTVAAAELAAFESEFALLVEEKRYAALDAFGSRVRRDAAGWTIRLVAAVETGTGPALDDELLADCREIATLLALAGPLHRGLDAVLEAAAGARLLDGRIVKDLAPPVLAAVATRYAMLAEAAGKDARYLLFALIDRLERPAQIFRLTATPAWPPAGAGEAALLTALCERLLGDLRAIARQIAECPAATAGQFTALNRLVDRYVTRIGDLIAAAEFRRAIATSTAFPRARGAARAAASAIADRHVEAARRTALLVADPPAESLAEGEERAGNHGLVERASAAAGLLVGIARRGGRHRMARRARGAIDELGRALDERGAQLIGTLRPAERNSGAMAELYGILKLTQMLFADERAQAMRHRIQAALKPAS